MQKIIVLIVAVCISTGKTFPQPDSIIKFSDLSFHSDFEKQAVTNFIRYQKDTFNIFLAIDENISSTDAEAFRDQYNKILSSLEKKNISYRKINGKIRVSYFALHRHLRRYIAEEYFPRILQPGNFNCVSTSILFALVYEKHEIPYRIMASSNHVYLVANPYDYPFIIETINPNYEKVNLTNTFKEQYVDMLKTSNQINEEEYADKSVDEIFYQKFNEMREASFFNLPGFQYYNKAYFHVRKNNTEEALRMCQKAYYFYPDQQVKMLLRGLLVYHIERSDFKNISDIDYLAQLSRFGKQEQQTVAGIFNKIILHELANSGKDLRCDSLYKRLISGVSDSLKHEITFFYNMQMSSKYINTDKVEPYIVEALKIKKDHKDASLIMQNFINRKLIRITDPYAVLDTIISLEKKYDQGNIHPVLREHELLSYLRIANNLFQKDQPCEAEDYLLQFEKNYSSGLNNNSIAELIENTYCSAALYYINLQESNKAKEYISRGLNYVPGSNKLDNTF